MSRRGYRDALLLMSLLFIFRSASLLAIQRDIYIDSNASPSGDGSVIIPYNRLSQINWPIISSWVSAGDSVFINLKCGSEFRELLTIGASGVATRAIFFRTYSAGARPIINGSDDISNAGNAYIWVSKGSNIYFLQTLDGRLGVPRPGGLWKNGIYQFERQWPLTSDNQWFWGNQDGLKYNTIYLYSSSGIQSDKIEAGMRPGCVFGQNRHYITFDNIELKQSGDFAANYAYHSIMYVYESDYWTVTNSLLHDSSALLGVIQLMRSSFFTLDSSEIYNSYDPDGNGYGALIGSESSSTKQSTNGIIRNCVIHDNFAPNSDLIGNAGVWSGSSAYGPSNWQIYNSTLYGHAQNAIYFRSGANNNIIHHNYIHDIRGFNTTGGIAVQIRDNANNNIVYNNIIINAYGPTMQSDGKNGGPGSVNPACSGNKFWYNTIMNGSMPNANAFHFFGTNTLLEAKNNIIVSNSGDLILIGANASDTTYKGITLSNNRYYKTTSSGQLFVYRGINYATLDALRASMQADGFPNEVNSSFGDPGFLVAMPTTALECRLSKYSPCLDQGVGIVGITDDYYAVARPYGLGPDIGACEYSSGISSPTNLRIIRYGTFLSSAL